MGTRAPGSVTGFLLFLLLLLISPPAFAATTHALVMANDEGLTSEPPLQFAQADAALVARTLVEVQAVPAGQVRLLVGASLGEMADGLRALAAVVRPEDTALVFFSGHGGSQGAHVGGRVWSWAEIRAALAALPARLVVGFFDACRSGALLTSKGQLMRAPPIAVTAQPLGPAGRFLVASSGAAELSYESVLLQGSAFALALRSGLRGLADGDGDGRITLAELYAFVYAHTVAATLSAPAGPQHPVGLTELRGAGQAVLVSRPGPAGLQRRSSDLGSCYVLDRRQSRVLGELPARPGARLHLHPGAYVVKCLVGGGLRQGPLTLADRYVALESLPLEPAARTYALARGAVEPTRHQLALGAGMLSAWRGGTAPALALGYRFEIAGLVLHPQVAVHAGGRGPGASAADGAPGGRGLLLTTSFAVVVPWWRVLGSRLELGAELGAQLGQRPNSPGSSAPSGPALLIGPHLLLSRPLSRPGQPTRLTAFAQLSLPTFYPTSPTPTAGALRFLAGLALTLDAQEEP
jgi:hypothetical protein